MSAGANPSRSHVLKALSATGAAAAAAPLLVRHADAADKIDIGAVRSVKVDVLSETSWFDNDKFKANMTEGGGASTSQYSIAWDPENSGGYSALITVTTLQGEEKKILLDSGWNNGWMDYVFEKKGIQRMLQRGEIDFMVLSHWHLDHLWGIESTLKNNPNIRIIAPKTYFPEDIALLREKGRFTAKDKGGREIVLAKNDVPHRGELVLTGPEGQNNQGVYKLMPGVALKMFDVPILLRVRGENVLYFNVQDKGIVTITGCCHPGILSLFSFAKQNFAGYQPYGAYGGLHLSLFETWDPKFDDVIAGVKAFKLQKVAANHCTGWLWAEKAAASGVPIVKGTDTYKTYKRQSLVARASNAYLTNGDSVLFG